MLRSVITDILDELSAPIIRETRFGELGTTLAVTSNRRKLRRNTKSPLRSVSRLLVTANFVPISPNLVTLMMEALSSSETFVLTEPHGVTSQKTDLHNSSYWQVFSATVW
jgi:hypothetical protein